MLLTEYDETEAMELFREEGRAEGRAETLSTNIRSLMASLGCTAEHAMDLLAIPEDERERYAEMT